MRVYRHVSAATSEAIAHSSKKKNDASFGAPLAIDLVDTLTRYLDASSEFKFQGLGMHDRPTLGEVDLCFSEDGEWAGQMRLLSATYEEDPSLPISVSKIMENALSALIQESRTSPRLLQR